MSVNLGCFALFASMWKNFKIIILLGENDDDEHNAQQWTLEKTLSNLFTLYSISSLNCDLLLWCPRWPFIFIQCALLLGGRKNYCTFMCGMLYLQGSMNIFMHRNKYICPLPAITWKMYNLVMRNQTWRNSNSYLQFSHGRKPKQI